MSAVLEVLKKEIENTQIVSPVGGRGSRSIPMQVVSLLRKTMGDKILNEIYMPKHLLEVHGKPLIQRFIEQFKGVGFKEFVFLLGNGSEEIENFLGNGDKFGVEIRYSYDPPLKKIGKGKAILNALKKGIIDRNKRSIIAFPDDLILYEYAPIELLIRHLHSKKKDKRIVATLLLSPYIKSPYGIAEVEGIKIINFKEKPNIPLFANTGISIIDPEGYEYIERLIDLSSPEPIEIESTVYPVLAKEGRLGYTFLPSGEDWIAVNSLKDLLRAEKVLTDQ